MQLKVKRDQVIAVCKRLDELPVSDIDIQEDADRGCHPAGVRRGATVIQPVARRRIHCCWTANRVKSAS